MKIIHCADLHLDSKMTANLSKEQAKERKMEILRTFSRMVSYAEKNGISVILIAGDMFDTRNVSAMVRNMVRDVIVENPKIDFLYLKGNHDSDNFLSKLDEIPSNLYLFSNQWRTYTYGNVAITGLELNSFNSQTVYNSLQLAPDKYNIVMLHGQLAGYQSKNKAEVISLDNLRNKNVDYLALGHIHKYKQDKLDARGVYCYSGCLEGRGFDECGEKGFVVLDTEKKDKEEMIKFVPFASRTLHLLSVDVTGVFTTQEVGSRINDAIRSTRYASNSLIKISLVGEVAIDCEIETAFLEEQFAEYFYFVKIYNETKLKVDYQDYAKDASLKGEFIRMVSEADLTEEEKALIIRTGLLALQGEEIG